MAKLGDVCVKVENIDSTYDDIIEYIDISSVDNNKKKIVSTQTIDYSGAPSRAKQLIQNGDILVSNVRPNLNAVALVDTETVNTLVASTGYTVIRCNNKAYNKYIFFFCQYSGFVDLITQQATGASYPAVNAGIIKSIPIPLPDLETQRKIAANLDKVTHTIDLCNAILEKLDLLVKSRFVEMFGDKKYPYQELISLIIEGAGLSYGIVQPGDDGTGDMGVLRPVDIVDGSIVLDNIKFIDREIASGYQKTELTGKELLITVRGTTGVTAVSDKRFCGMNVTRGIAVIRYDEEKINPIYLNEYLKSDESQRYIQENTRGATLKQINLSDLRIQKILGHL